MPSDLFHLLPVPHSPMGPGRVTSGLSCLQGHSQGPRRPREPFLGTRPLPAFPPTPVPSGKPTGQGGAEVRTPLLTGYLRCFLWASPRSSSCWRHGEGAVQPSLPGSSCRGAQKQRPLPSGGSVQPPTRTQQLALTSSTPRPPHHRPLVSLSEQ